MARPIPESALRAIEEVVRQYPEGVTARQISDALGQAPALRTLQYHLKSLIGAHRLVMVGYGRSARYALPSEASVSVSASAGRPTVGVRVDVIPQLSEAGAEIQTYVTAPLEARTPVGYNRAFLDDYVPNETTYLSVTERDELRRIGTPARTPQPAGTYARRMLHRVPIDLSWNSSRLEGNTYSLLDTQRLIEEGEAAEGKRAGEAQMIVNHKEAIQFLVDGAGEVGFNRYTVTNLHGLLADNLLADPDAVGKVRTMVVGIEGSAFHPLGIPQLIEDCLHQLLSKASAIQDPFEQAFFVLVQLPYLQPFDDVNKRVSRLAANIPLIRANLVPLSFEDVPRELYTEAVLGVYELNRVELLRDVFLRAYRRSAARYVAVRQSLGEPDPFRIQHRSALRELVGAVVRNRMDQKGAVRYVRAWVDERIDPSDRERFLEMSERELIGLHSGSFARFGIRQSEFWAWHEVWRT